MERVKTPTLKSVAAGGGGVGGWGARGEGRWGEGSGGSLERVVSSWSLGTGF